MTLRLLRWLGGNPGMNRWQITCLAIAAVLVANFVFYIILWLRS